MSDLRRIYYAYRKFQADRYYAGCNSLFIQKKVLTLPKTAPAPRSPFPDLFFKRSRISPTPLLTQPVSSYAKLSFYLGLTYLNTVISNVRTFQRTSFRPYYLRFYMKGVGYRVWFRRGGLLIFKLGFTHKFVLPLSKYVNCRVHKYKLLLFSFDKKLLFEVAKTLLSLRVPDAYKGKGVRYFGDKIFSKSRLKDAKRR